MIVRSLRWMLLGFFVICPVLANADNYLQKFQQYLAWSLHFPTTATPDFIAFINQSTPLSRKLRERWLYQLVRNKDWAGFLNLYQPSADPNLQCYSLLAKLRLGQGEAVVEDAKHLWLQSTSQPNSCTEIFNWLLTTHDTNQALIAQRASIALDARNIGLALHLLNRFKPQRTTDIKLLQAIHQNPKRIASLSPGNLHGDFYLYGLKRLVTSNMDEAIKYWQLPAAKQLLNQQQSQAFLAFLVIYKAMRDSNDTEHWFAKIHPQYYTDILLDWEIRYSLKHHQWQRVIDLIPQSPQHDEPCWQYWLARAYEAQGDTAKSLPLFQNLAKSRHYYGFLASLRLHRKPHFDNEVTSRDPKLLSAYRPITDQIKTLYNTHQVAQASSLINDFASEMPKENMSAFVQWIDQDLQWHSKAVALSNNDVLNDQLTLRFPLAYPQSVNQNASRYHIPRAFIYAIIRQESGFREDVISPAGAHGLMQLMPLTAKKIAQEKKIPYSNKNQLFLTQQNITLGTAYLQQLSQRFSNHPILMAAAYNAGPSQVNYWLKNHPPKQIDIWIDTLPWRETRNYLKNILAFYTVYQYRLKETTDLDWFMKEFD